jgi:hypothetical protein
VQEAIASAEDMIQRINNVAAMKKARGARAAE